MLLDGDRIASISGPAEADAFLASAGHEALIDAGDLTVMPGLIDSHDHLGLDIGDEDAQTNQPDAVIAIRGVKNARYILSCGVTLIRDLGEKNHIDFALRDAIEAGVIPGPSLLCSGMAVTRTGGHGHMGLSADGPDEVRRAVRQQLKAGADVIKLMVTGGISTRGSSPLTADYTMEEIQVAADEARSRGKTTSAHAYGGAGAVNSIKAGITSLEHGSFLSKDELAMMAEHGTFLVTTMGGIIGSARGRFEVPAFMLPQLQRAAEVYLDAVRNARAAGVRVTPGTDENHGQLATEMEYLMECGWSPMEALCSATSLAARLCNLDADLGSIAAGKYADLLAVRGSPLEDIHALERVAKVIKRGRLVVDNGRVLD